MIYSRELENEVYTAALNFSGREITLGPVPAAVIRAAGRVAVSNTGRTEADGKLLPWEGLLFKKNVSEREV